MQTAVVQTSAVQTAFAPTMALVMRPQLPLPQRLSAGFVLSIALHLTCLWIVIAPPGAQFGGKHGARAVTARVIAAPERPIAPVEPSPQAAVQPVPPKPLPPKPVPDTKPAAEVKPRPAERPPVQADTPPVTDIITSVTTPPVSGGEAASTVRDGAYYFAASELDRGAEPLGGIDPRFPAGTERVEGYLFARVLINEIGRVDEVEILVSDPEGVFDDSVRMAFLDARFKPATRDGVPVKSRKDVEVKFDPGLPQLTISGVLPPGTIPPGLLLPGTTVVPLRP